MNFNRIKLCEAFGIPIYLEFSLVILLILFVTDFRSFTLGVSCALLLALSITAHELGHALTARAFGYRTRDITLSLLGGCASLIALPRTKGQEFLTAVAGPLVSFAISGLCYAALVFLPIADEFAAALLGYGFYMNLVLGGFNLLPGFPMDGGRVFRSIARIFTTRAKATYAAMVVGRVFAVLLALRGLHSVFSGGAWGFVSILIAWMIWKEGYREYLQALEEERFGWSDDDFVNRVSPPPWERD